MLDNLKNKEMWLIGYIDYNPFDFISNLKNISSYHKIWYDGQKTQKRFMVNGTIKENSLFLAEMDNILYFNLMKKDNFMPNPISVAEKNLSKIIEFKPYQVIPYAFKTLDYFAKCPIFEQQIKRRTLLKNYFISFLNDINDNFDSSSYSDIVCLSGKIHIHDYLKPDFFKENLKDLTINIAYF